MFKIAFFDIDWTLFDHKNHVWPKSAVSSLKALKEKGIKVVLCTARPYHSMEAFGVFDLGIDFDGYISSAGGVAYCDGVFALKNLMKGTDVISFCNKAKEKSLTLELVEVTTRKLVFPLTEYSNTFYEAFHEVVPPMGKYEGEEVVGINLFAPDSVDKEFMDAFPQLIYSRYFETAVDVMGTPHLKGLAVKSVLEHYGYKKEEAIGFGDDLQDISMAEHVGSFVCMGQGKDEVKKIATYVSTPVWEDGVYDGLRHFKLL